MEEHEGTAVEARPDRLQLAKDVVVFQAKLALDGLLDFLLIPVSIVAAVVSFFESDQERDAFYRVVAAGARADRWINLFGAVERMAPHADDGARVDDVVDRVEAYLRREYAEGRLPARGTVDAVIRRLRGDVENPQEGRHVQDS